MISGGQFVSICEDFASQRHNQLLGWVLKEWERPPHADPDLPHTGLEVRNVNLSIQEGLKADINICYDTVFSVPKIVFLAYSEDGDLLKAEQLSSMCKFPNGVDEAHPLVGNQPEAVISAGLHPITSNYTITLHPCETGSTLMMMNVSVESGWRYITSFLSLHGSFIGMPNDILDKTMTTLWKRLNLIRKLLDCKTENPILLQHHPRAQLKKKVTDADVAKLISNRFRGKHGTKPTSHNDITYMLVNDAITKGKQQGWDVGIRTHNAVLSIFSRMADTRSCDTYFSSIPRNIVKDEQTFNSVLLAHAKTASSVDSQIKYITYLTDLRNLSLNESNYTALTKFMFFRNIPKGAYGKWRSKLLGNSDEQKVEFNRTKSEIIKELLQSCKLSPSVEVLNTALGCYTTGRSALPSFEEFFITEETKIHNPDRYTLLAFLKTCDGSETRLASKVFKLCCGEDTFGYFTPTVVEWTALLNVYKTANNLTALNRIWDQLIQQVTPNSFTYATYVRGCLADPFNGLSHAKAKYRLALDQYEASMPHLHQNMLELLIANDDVVGVEEVMENVNELGISGTREIKNKYRKFMKERVISS